MRKGRWRRRKMVEKKCKDGKEKRWKKEKKDVQKKDKLKKWGKENGKQKWLKGKISERGNRIKNKKESNEKCEWKWRKKMRKRKIFIFYLLPKYTHISRHI